MKVGFGIWVIGAPSVNLELFHIGWGVFSDSGMGLKGSFGVVMSCRVAFQHWELRILWVWGSSGCYSGHHVQDPAKPPSRHCSFGLLSSCLATSTTELNKRCFVSISSLVSQVLDTCPAPFLRVHCLCFVWQHPHNFTHRFGPPLLGFHFGPRIGI